MKGKSVEMNEQQPISEKDIEKIKYLCEGTKIFVPVYKGHIFIKKGKVIKESAGEELHNPDWHLILQAFNYQRTLQGGNTQLKQRKKESQKENREQSLIDKAKRLLCKWTSS